MSFAPNDASSMAAKSSRVGFNAASFIANVFSLLIVLLIRPTVVSGGLLSGREGPWGSQDAREHVDIGQWLVVSKMAKLFRKHVKANAGNP